MQIWSFFLTRWYLNFGNVILGIDKPCVPLRYGWNDHDDNYGENDDDDEA